MRPHLLALLVASLLLSSGTRVHAQCADWRDGPVGNGGANGTNGTVTATVLWDPDGAGPLQSRLVVAGSFTQVEGVPAHNIAMRDPLTGHWQAIGNGVNIPVSALTVYNGQLVAAGPGDNDPGTPDNNILTFDGTNWLTLNGGTSTGSVAALVVYNGELYAGGNFIIYPTLLDPAVNFAHWNSSHHVWEQIQSTFAEFNGPITCFMVYSGSLLVGGSFTHDGFSAQKNLIQFNGSTFSAWNSGSDQPVFSLNIYNGFVAACSSYSTSSGYSITVGLWTGSSWTPLGGIYPHGLNNTFTIANYNGQLIVGGSFTLANNATANHMALWDGSAWQPMLGGTDATVYTMIQYNGELIVGGAFTHANSQVANHLARWNGSAWSTYGGGTASSVLALTYFNGREVAGGNFSQSLDLGPAAQFIAGWDGATLSSFGSGMDNPVFALKTFRYTGVFGSNELIAGGSFTHAGGVAANFIARWDENPIIAFPGPAWAAMGPGFSGPVTAIERFSNATYAGGTFISSGATTLNRIGRWNESTKLWEALGSGMNGPVYALKVFGSYLYAGGTFTSANGIATGGLARWDGTSWSAVGGFFSGSVYALEVNNGVLVIGGNYPGISASPNIAYYNGTSYGLMVSGGTNGTVRALHSTGSRLYMGGDFTTVGAISANHVAYADFFWHDMNGGTDNSVYALGNYHNIAHVGGTFTHVRGGTLLAEAWAEFDETGVPAMRYNPSSQNPNIGDNVVLSAAPDTGYTGLSLQWLHNNQPLVDGPTGYGSTIIGSHSETLNILSFAAPDIGDYVLVVSNGCGSTTSGVATLTGPLAVDGSPAPHVTTFDAIAPNPSRSATQVAFSLAHDAHVSIRIQDVAGRTVRSIDAGRLVAGQHRMVWDARGEDGQTTRPGMYFVGLELDGRRFGTKTVAIVR